MPTPQFAGPETGSQPVLPRRSGGDTGAELLRTPAAAQWISTTLGRIAPDTYTWMQAVHWIHGTGAYTPAGSHGPGFGRTTLLVAQELTKLTPCRPGVAYLARRLQVSSRTVKYHLGILRECGLLAYLVKGTRVRGERARASEFARIIPASFDQALGIRTGPSDTYIRTVVGADGAGRGLLAKLGRKASRTIRRAPQRTGRKSVANPDSASSGCTPMGGGTSTSFPAGPTTVPSEAQLADRARGLNPSEGRRPGTRLNKVGRRYQLARELVERLPWLQRTSVARVAWAVRHVSDAGWSAEEVIAVLAQRSAARLVHRPCGFLTARLTGAHLLYDTPAKRANIVAWWRDSPQASAERHAQWQGSWQAPRSIAVQRLVGEARAEVSRSRACQAQEIWASDEPTRTEAHTAAWRQYLAGQPHLVLSALALGSREEAEQLYGRDLVDRVLRLRTTSSHLRAGATR